MPVVVQPRVFNLRKTIVVGSVILALIVFNAVRKPPSPRNPTWDGFTMGTTFLVKIADSPLGWDELYALKADVEGCLEAINASMSTYLPDSEISRFNQFSNTTPFEVSPAMAQVTSAALTLAKASHGAFDPTVLPLVRLWGFGDEDPATPSRDAPSEEQLREVMERTGFNKVSVPSPTSLQKSHPGVELDLSAIAKGYAVDEVARLILATGVNNLFVEIGGECIAYGKNPDQGAWRVGIDRPVYESGPGESLQALIEVTGRAVATSGDYRNFFTLEDGQRVSHLFDPRSLRPVQQSLASVTLVADSCMLADALATTLYVMGPKEGLAWLVQRGDAEALFISRTKDGFIEERTPGFKTINLDETDSTD